MHRLDRRVDLVDGRAERCAFGQVERQGDRGKLRQMTDHERCRPGLDFGDGGKRYLAGAAGLRRQVERSQRLQVRQAVALGHEDHAILRRLVEDRRDDALAQRIVERVVDGRRRDAVARRKLAIDFDVDRQALVVEVAGDVADRLDLLHPFDDLRDVCLEVLPAGPAQHELILAGRDRRIERQVLFGPQVELDAGNVRHFALDAPGDLPGAPRAVVDRLEIDQETAVVQGLVGAVDADIRGQAVDVGVLQDGVGQCCLARRHSLVGDRVVGDADALDDADILDGKQSLRDDDVEDARQGQGEDRHEQGQSLVAQHPAQAALVGRQHAVEQAFAQALEPAWLTLRAAAQHARAQHRHEGQRDDAGQHDRDGERDGEFAEQASDHARNSRE